MSIPALSCRIRQLRSRRTQIQRLASNVKHIVLFFTLLATGFFLLAGSVHAQTTKATTNALPSTTTKQTNNYYSPNLNPDVPRDQHSQIQAVMIETMSAMVCQLSGIDFVRQNQKCLGVDQSTGKIGFVENGGGAIGVMGTFIAATFTPPVSSGDYVRYLSGNFGIAKNTYAQKASSCAGASGGVGLCGINQLLNIWVSMRNIAYLLFVIIFVLMGLAIMLRVHIDPRTVMTIENQVPKIIVGILLVTFSFAIAGLLIDIMYVAIYLVGGVLADIPGHRIDDFGLIATSPTPFDAINRLWPGGKGTLDGGGFPELALQGSDTIRNLVINALNGNQIDGQQLNFQPGLLDLIGGLFISVVGLFIGLLSALIIFIALIYTAIRLWIILVVAYINILIDIVFAPFWFLIGLFPGSTVGVGAWFRDMVANLAVFPTALSMLILARVFSGIASSSPDIATSGSLFIPPLVGGGTGADSQIFAGIIALGFLFLTPNVLNVTKGAVKATGINYGPVFQPAGQAGATLGGFASGYGAYAAKTPLPGAQGGKQALARRIFKF